MAFVSCLDRGLTRIRGLRGLPHTPPHPLCPFVRPARFAPPAFPAPPAPLTTFVPSARFAPPAFPQPTPSALLAAAVFAMAFALPANLIRVICVIRLIRDSDIFLLQQLDKPRLFKVVISCQGVGQSTLLHYDKARAIHEAPFFVQSVFE